MNLSRPRLALCCALAVILPSCESMPQLSNRDGGVVGTVGGAGVGALLGAAAGKRTGQSGAGAVVGAIGGGMAGNQIGRKYLSGGGDIEKTEREQQQ